MNTDEWFIIIKGEQKGPYTANQLKEIPLLTPDTLVWQKGMDKWLPIRQIPELNRIFKDKEEKFEIEKDEVLKSNSEDLILSLSSREPPIYIWVALLMILILYALYQIYT